MNETEYRNELQKIEDNYNLSKKNLYIKYARENRRFAIGDIIKDSSGTIIIVTSFNTSLFGGLPKPIYIGKVLKKDLTPRKDNSTDSIYESQNIALIKKAN